MVDAPCVFSRGIDRHRVSSRSLLTMTCAHLRPGRFQAFDAETIVSVWFAVTGETLAYGMWRAPG